MAFTLKDFQNSAAKQFAALEIDTPGGVLNLRNILRLDDDERDAFLKESRSIGNDDDDDEGEDLSTTLATQRGKLEGMVLLLADDKTLAQKFLDEVGGDLATLMAIMKEYGVVTKQGGSVGLSILIDKYGRGLFHDLQRYHNIDLVHEVGEWRQGRGIAPDFLLVLIGGLPPEGMYAAMRHAETRGGEWQDWMGRGYEWYLLADIYDAVWYNTKFTGNWKKGKAPKVDAYPRPGTPPEDESKPQSLAGLQAMFAKMSGAKR